MNAYTSLLCCQHIIFSPIPLIGRWPVKSDAAATVRTFGETWAKSHQQGTKSDASCVTHLMSCKVQGRLEIMIIGREHRPCSTSPETNAPSTKAMILPRIGKSPCKRRKQESKPVTFGEDSLSAQPTSWQSPGSTPCDICSLRFQAFRPPFSESCGSLHRDRRHQRLCLRSTPCPLFLA